MISNNNHMFQTSLFAITSVCFWIYILDSCISRINYNARWFQLHAIINYTVSYLTYTDVVECFIDPNASKLVIGTTLSSYFILILHLYHCIAFNIRCEDWIHHISSVFVTAPITILYPYKSVSVIYFFGCGLPGAIDYTMLTLLKNDIIVKKTQKRACANINAYMRMPGGVVGALLLFKDGLMMNRNIPLLFLSFVTYANVTFYGKQAIETYGKMKLKPV
jgi:hypothetical protein